MNYNGIKLKYSNKFVLELDKNDHQYLFLKAIICKSYMKTGLNFNIYAYEGLAVSKIINLES